MRLPNQNPFAFIILFLRCEAVINASKTCQKPESFCMPPRVVWARPLPGCVNKSSQSSVNKALSWMFSHASHSSVNKPSLDSVYKGPLPGCLIHASHSSVNKPSWDSVYKGPLPGCLIHASHSSVNKPSQGNVNKPSQSSLSKDLTWMFHMSPRAMWTSLPRLMWTTS